MSALATQEHLLFTAQRSSLLMRCVAFPNSLLDPTPWGSARMEQLLILSRLYSLYFQDNYPRLHEYCLLKMFPFALSDTGINLIWGPWEPWTGVDTFLTPFLLHPHANPGRLRVNIYSNKKHHFSESCLFLIDIWGVTCQWFGVHLRFSFPHYTKHLVFPNP